MIFRGGPQLLLHSKLLPGHHRRGPSISSLFSRSLSRVLRKFTFQLLLLSLDSPFHAGADKVSQRGSRAVDGTEWGGGTEQILARQGHPDPWLQSPTTGSWAACCRQGTSERSCGLVKISVLRSLQSKKPLCTEDFKSFDREKSHAKKSKTLNPKPKPV